MSHQGFQERGAAFVMFIPSCLSLVVWSCIWVIYLLEIISETAAGNDSIVEWPELFPFSSWTGSFFYGANALAVAVAPAVLFTSLVRVPPMWMPIVLAVSMYAILPPVLLSMLSANSPLSVCSGEVLRRMSGNKRSSLLFYAATFVVYAVAVVIGYLLSLIPMAWPVCGVVFVMASFLVARLIGRLGWVLGQAPNADTQASAVRR